MKHDLIDVFGLVMAIASILIAVIFQTLTPEKQVSSLALLFVIILAYFVIAYSVDKFREMSEAFQENTSAVSKVQKDLKALSDKFNLASGLNRLEARMTEMEKKMKGSIDPRIVAIVLMLIALFLFLRAKGVI